MIAFGVDGQPIPQGSLRPFMAGGRPQLRYSNREPLAMWRDSIRDACPIDDPQLGPFIVDVVFRMKRPAGHYGGKGLLPRFEGSYPVSRPDLDKLIRAVLDALTMRVWRDDAQVIGINARKIYDRTPGVDIVITDAMGTTLDQFRQ